jgi:hypothetical protein
MDETKALRAIEGLHSARGTHDTSKRPDSEKLKLLGGGCITIITTKEKIDTTYDHMTCPIMPRKNPAGTSLEGRPKSRLYCFLGDAKAA